MRITLTGEPEAREIIGDSYSLRAITMLRREHYEPECIIKILELSLKESITPGIGLAAPQIGINTNIAIVRTSRHSINLVNPIIVEKNKGFVNFGEGCLSLPGVAVNTQRYREVFVKDDLRPEGFVVTGLAAIAVQHECDHLSGILITDRSVGKKKVGRNDRCPCGSGKKYKKCCNGR
jgi:peptide deformylase